VTTSAEQLTKLELDHAAAVEQAQALADRKTQARDEAEQERRRRRDETWRAQVAEIEGQDLAGDVRRARQLLAASIRGEETIAPITALFDLVVAERRLDTLAKYAAERRQQLGMGDAVAPAPRSINMVELLQTTFNAEVERTVGLEQDRLAVEVEQAWNGPDLPSVPRRFDPVQHLRLQDQLANAAARVSEARGRLQAAEAADDDSPTKQDAVTGAQAELDIARETLKRAQGELLRFQTGRPAPA
jgi:hypothetical protein